MVAKFTMLLAISARAPHASVKRATLYRILSQVWHYHLGSKCLSFCGFYARGALVLLGFRTAMHADPRHFPPLYLALLLALYMVYILKALAPV